LTAAGRSCSAYWRRARGIDPNPWQYQTHYLDKTAEAGGRVFGQATTRSINAVFSLNYANLFPMFGVDWDDPSFADLARAKDQHPVEVMIDLMLAKEDRLFVQPLVNERPEDVLGLLKHPRTLATFSDSGAHVCQEMGFLLQTHLLNYWVRNKEQFTLEQSVRMLTFDNASAWELPDRGLVRTGYAGDLVVFDEARVRPCLPKVEQDLPGGARRLVIKAEGIAAVVVNGTIAVDNGEWTSSCAGRVLKGPLAQA
jgi:N-acyl-D-amino-acid deacylase